MNIDAKKKIQAKAPAVGGQAVVILNSQPTPLFSPYLTGSHLL